MRWGVVWMVVLLLVWACGVAEEPHLHGAPEKLGEVSFPVSCAAAVQPEFNRAVALLHSFAYASAEQAFREVARHDPKCAMAHWGVSMTLFHELWEPQIAPGTEAEGLREVEVGLKLDAATERESGFLRAARAIFEDAGTVPYAGRALRYEQAMAELADANKKDAEAQVFYALALEANMSPADRTHARQKKAAAVLEPLFYANPEHPGVAHYLIHACDNAEMAERGLAAAQLYSKVALSAPHALHMPSHIFTRLGRWEESIGSNLAAREAAHRAGDTGEELYAMDYLVYAYLQSGKYEEAAEIVRQVKAMPTLKTSEFKIGYAATAMPVRYAVERRQWAEAAKTEPTAGAPPQVTAIAVWARGLGLARGGHADAAARSVEDLEAIEGKLHAAGIEYWATQVRVMRREVEAWSAQARGKKEEAVRGMEQAADEEDSLEKLPVTPGPIVPAREQLGDLLLEQGQKERAREAFRTALGNAPGRKGAREGLERAEVGGQR